MSLMSYVKRCTPQRYFVAVFTQPDGDFRLFVTDAGGRIYTLNSDLSLNRSLNAGSQVVGIAADPNSTHDDYRVVYSTLDTEKYPIMELFIESLKATTLYSSISTLFCS